MSTTVSLDIDAYELADFELAIASGAKADTAFWAKVTSHLPTTKPPTVLVNPDARTAKYKKQAWRWARRLLCGDTALVKRLIETLNIKVTPAKVDLLFDEADDNKDGTVDRKELPTFVAAAIKFERNKESDSLHHAQQVVLGENQLIDRFSRAASRSLIEIVAE